MIRVENLTVKYLYGAEAINNLSFECEDGERVAVLAAGEGGKTSLLKCIAGLYPAGAGQIYLGNKNITALKPRERDMLMIYEDGGIIKRKSLRFHLEYPLKLRKIDKNERNKRVLTVSKKFGLYPALSDPAGFLYEDDIIRLSFARAAIREAEVYLIDDPFKAIKGEERRTLFLELLPAVRALRGSVIFASSSPDEAFSVGDKVIVLNYGRHEQTGTPEEIINSPSSLAVDKLVNKKNARIESFVSLDEKGAYIEIFSKRFTVPDQYAGKRVVLSFGIDESENGLAFMPSNYGYSDNQKYVYFEDGGALFTDEPIKEKYFLVPRGKIHIFDISSEKRLTSII